MRSVASAVEYGVPLPRPGLAPGLILCAALLLAGCGMGAYLPGSGATDKPEATPTSPAATPESRAPVDAKAEAELVRFYANVQDDLTASGRMRLETAPADAPYGVSELVRDFERVALYDEYVDLDGKFVRSETPALLRRWNQPVRVGVMTSGSVPPAEAAHDRGNVAAFTRRLARLTGVDMAMSGGDQVNFLVLFMNSTEREAFADQVSGRYPTFAPAVVNALRDTPLDTFCTTYAFADPADPSLYSAVMILIRAEHPPLTRLSCVHEEMAQAMGLPNDSPEARPSLFSDSLEFALLTEHDEILLRMLYDPRLRPGMTSAEARPLLPAIAADAIAAEQRQNGLATVATN